MAGQTSTAELLEKLRLHEDASYEYRYGMRVRCIFGGGMWDDIVSSVPLKDVKAAVIIRDRLAFVEIRQVYVNDGHVVRASAEIATKIPDTKKQTFSMMAVYSFPVDPDAAVYSVEFEINGKPSLTSVVKPKKEATEAFEAATKAGQMTGMVERESSDVLKLSIGNLRIGDVVVATTKYACELHTEPIFGGPSGGAEAKIRFVFPTAMAPRYGASRSGMEFEPGGSANRPLVKPSDAPYKFSLKIEAKNSSGIESVSWERPAAWKRWVVLRDGGSATFEGSDLLMDGDARALIVPARREGDACMAQWDPATCGMSACVTVDVPRDRMGIMMDPAECCFVAVVDRSGSMSGEKIRSAIDATLLFVDMLRDGSSFGIVAFDDRVDLVSRIRPSSNKDFVEEARQALQKIDARGGTEVMQAMQAAYNMIVSSKSAPKDGAAVLLITDGMVNNMEQTIRIASLAAAGSYPLGSGSLGPKIKTFVLGIGNAVSLGEISNLAAAGMGAHDVAILGDRIDVKVQRMLTKMQSKERLVGSLSISCEGLDGWSLRSGPESPLFPGDSAMLHCTVEASDCRAFDAKSMGDRDVIVTLREDFGDVKSTRSWMAKFGEISQEKEPIYLKKTPKEAKDIKQQQQQQQQEPTAALATSGRARIHVLGAWKRIRNLTTKQATANDDKNIAEIEMLGMKYGLSTTQTSFIMVDPTTLATKGTRLIWKPVPGTVPQGEIFALPRAYARAESMLYASAPPPSTAYPPALHSARVKSSPQHRYALEAQPATTVPAEPRPKTAEDEVMEIVKSQNPREGWWNPAPTGTEKLVSALKIALGKYMQGDLLDKVTATAVTMCFLEMKYQAQQAIWINAMSKADAYMKSVILSFPERTRVDIKMALKCE
jgi:hypothetical protein